MPEAHAGEPWPWIAGVLALANAAQFYAASKDRQQARTDMMLMLPAITSGKESIESLRVLVTDFVKSLGK